MSKELKEALLELQAGILTLRIEKAILSAEVASLVEEANLPNYLKKNLLK